LSVSNSRIARARHFSLFAIGDTLSLTLSSATAVAAAVGGLGAWSLVIQQLVLWTAKSAWILPASGFRPKLVCIPRLSKGLLAFGLNNVGANIADFLGKSAPALVIGAEIGVVAVGHYSMAYQLVRMPEFVLSGPLFLATFTAISVAHEAGAEPAGLALRTLRMTVAILAPLFCGLACVSDLLVGVFLGSRWDAAAPVLAALAPAGFFMCLYSVAGAVLMGFGRSDLQFRLSLVCGLCMLAGIGLGAHFGLVWAAGGVAVGAAAASPFYLAMLSSQLGAGARERLLGNLTGPVVSSAAMVAVLGLARLALAHADRRLELASLVLLGVVAYAASMTVTSGRQLIDDVRRVLPDRAPRLAA
jgi:PST family polysaccharide transporter